MPSISVEAPLFLEGREEGDALAFLLFKKGESPSFSKVNKARASPFFTFFINGFSQYGNSLESILNLIDKSKQGVLRVELEEILKIGISKQIQILVGQEKVYRVKLGSKYLYLPEEVMKNKKKKYRLLGYRQTEDYFEKEVRKKDLIALLKAVLEL